MSEFARIFVGFLFVLCLSFSVSAATFTVNSTADSGLGSLRQAVLDANAAAGDDVIEFSSLFNTSQTITLTGGEIVVAANGSLTINGPGADKLTISGNNQSRILSSGANVVVNINNLRFTAGNGVGAVNSGRGGAIYNVGGTMVITNSIITGNSAGNGGALNNAASASPSVPANLTIINCSITGNSSTSSGSAMQNFSTSTLHLRNTTVSGNTTTATGIAGAFQANGTVTITNSTFSGNTAPAGTGGGVYYNGSSMIMTNTTIVNNSSGIGGGGLHRTGTNPTLIMRNTIVAGNNGAAASPDALGLVSSQGNNIIGNNAGSTGWIGSDFQNVNPMLGGLAANGGLGNTHLPSAGSPALDAGQSCVVDLTCAVSNPPVAVTTDQRGIARPQNAIVDIGAVEVAVAANATISGQVLSPNLTPVRNAYVTISNMSGAYDSVRTNNLGNFTFKDIPVGQYTLDVIAKQYGFTPQNINVSGDITGVTITATSGNIIDSK